MISAEGDDHDEKGRGPEYRRGYADGRIAERAEWIEEQEAQRQQRSDSGNAAAIDELADWLSGRWMS